MAYQPAQHLLDKVSKAKALLTLDHPFFASTLLKKHIVWDENCPTMAVDARGTIYLGPQFVEGLSVNQLIWGLAHECMHYMLLHPARKGQRKHMPWNWACDGVINDVLDDAKVGERIPKTVDVQGARNMKAEDLYQDHPDNGGSGGGSGGQGGQPDFDDLKDADKLTDAEISEIAAQVKVDMVQARNAAKAQGKLPAGIARMVDDIVNVPTPWHTILERYMTGFVKSEQSWSRPNKRTLPARIYLPSSGKAPSMGTVVIGVDTSGSIGGPELAEFQGHLNAILDQCSPEKVVVVYCDARVGSHEEFTLDQLPAKFTKVTGGGGTDLTKIFDWVDEQGVEPDVVVVLTDGYTPFGGEPSGYPVVWLMTSDVEAPYGENIRFKNK